MIFLQENSSTSAAIIPAIKAFIPTCKAFSAIGRLLATVAIDILLSEASLSAEESSEISSRKDEAKIIFKFSSMFDDLKSEYGKVENL